MFLCDVEALCGALQGFQPQLFLFTERRIILPKKHKFLRWGCYNGTLRSGRCCWTKTVSIAPSQVHMESFRHQVMACFLWESDLGYSVPGTSQWVCRMGKTLLFVTYSPAVGDATFLLHSHLNSFYAESLSFPPSLTPRVIAKLPVKNSLPSQEVYCIFQYSLVKFCHLFLSSLSSSL